MSARPTKNVPASVQQRLLNKAKSEVVFPKPEESLLLTLLDYPVPQLLCYSRESAIAEKFEAMLRLGALNSRMQDFYSRIL